MYLHRRDVLIADDITSQNKTKQNTRILFKADSLLFGQLYDSQSGSEEIPGRYCRVIVSNTGMLVSWYRHICLLLHTRGIWNPETFIVLGLEMHCSLRWNPLRTFFALVVMCTEDPFFFICIHHSSFRHDIEALSVSPALSWGGIYCLPVFSPHQWPAT